MYVAPDRFEEANQKLFHHLKGSRLVNALVVDLETQKAGPECGEAPPSPHRVIVPPDFAPNVISRSRSPLSDSCDAIAFRIE